MQRSPSSQISQRGDLCISAISGCRAKDRTCRRRPRHSFRLLWCLAAAHKSATAQKSVLGDHAGSTCFARSITEFVSHGDCVRIVFYSRHLKKAVKRADQVLNSGLPHRRRKRSRLCCVEVGDLWPSCDECGVSLDRLSQLRKDCEVCLRRYPTDSSLACWTGFFFARQESRVGSFSILDLISCILQLTLMM